MLTTTVLLFGLFGSWIKNADSEGLVVHANNYNKEYMSANWPRNDIAINPFLSHISDGWRVPNSHRLDSGSVAGRMIKTPAKSDSPSSDSSDSESREELDSGRIFGKEDRDWALLVQQLLKL